MDHLPKVKDPLYHIPEVPYFRDARFTYERPQHKFPLRVDPKRVVSPSGPRKEWVWAYTSFVQQWLFFGTLDSFCATQNLPFQWEDFVRDDGYGREFITNEKLNEYLVAYIVENHRATGTTLTGENFHNKAGTSTAAREILRKTARSLQEILAHLQTHLRETIIKEDLDPSVWDSLLILGSTLNRSTEAMYLGWREEGKGNVLKSVSFADFETRSFPSIWQNSDWCPRERRVIAELVDHGQSELAFLGQINRNEPFKSHRECDESKCVAYQVEPDVQVAKHCLTDCGSYYFSEDGGHLCTFIGRDVKATTGDDCLSVDETDDELASINSRDGSVAQDIFQTQNGSDIEDVEDSLEKLKTDEKRDFEAAETRALVGDTEPETPLGVAGDDETPRLSANALGVGTPLDEGGPDLEALTPLTTVQSGDSLDSLGTLSGQKDPYGVKGFQHWAKRTYAAVRKHFDSVEATVYIPGDPETQYGGPKRGRGRLETRKIPLVKSDASGLTNFQVQGWNLVAVSHVWADGLGNTSGNAVAECQLARLQKLVDFLFKEKSHHPVPFWLDTLMVPKTVANPNQEQRRAKIRALRDMEWVYKNASKIMVLDHSLLSVDAEGMTPEEVGARIMCSPWSRRLWTLQEGCLENRTFFVFADQVKKWPQLHHEVRSKLSISKWKSHHSKLPKKHPLRKQHKISGCLPRSKLHNVAVLGPLGAWKAPPTAAYFAQDYQKTNVKLHVDKRAYQALNPVWWRIHNFLQDMSSNWTLLGSEGLLIPRAMRGMFYRDCSNPEDESLVLTSLMHFPAGSAARLWKEEPSMRYKVLFRSQWLVPTDIIFMDQERYDDDTDRIRWIPKSMLNVQSPSSRPLYRAEVNRGNYWPRQNRKGMVLRLSAFILQPQPRRMSFEPLLFRHKGTHWEAHFRRPGTREPVAQGPEEADWVLMPERLFYNETSCCSGALLKVVKGGKIITETRYVAFVDLKRPNGVEEGLAPLPFVETEFKEVKQGEWAKRPHLWRAG